MSCVGLNMRRDQGDRRRATEPGGARRRRPGFGSTLCTVAVRVLLYAPLIVASLASLFPFWYMIVLATKDRAHIFAVPPPMWFGDSFMQNYGSLLAQIPFWRNMWNSVYIALVGTSVSLFFCALGGFAFAMYRFRGREALFRAMLGTVMVPGWVMIIPTFILMKRLGWYNTPRALWVPGLANAMGIFMMRQYIASAVPPELMDSARIDGCGEFGIFWRIVIPLIRPALGAHGLMSFTAQWNAFVMPLVMLHDRSTYTLPVALRSMQGIASVDYGAVMAGSVISTLPVAIVFAAMSKQFIAGLTRGATKG